MGTLSDSVIQAVGRNTREVNVKVVKLRGWCTPSSTATRRVNQHAS